MSSPISLRVSALTLTPTSDTDCPTSSSTDAASGVPADSHAIGTEAVCRKEEGSDSAGSEDTGSHESHADAAPGASTTTATRGPISLARARVDAAVTNYGRAQDQLALAKDGARGIALLRDNLPDLQTAAQKAGDELKAAVGAEFDAEVDADASAGVVAKASGKIAARYAMYTPQARAALSSALTDVTTARGVHAVVAVAQHQADPAKALHTLSAAYSQAPQTVKDALLHAPAAQKIVDDAAAWANQPLAQGGADTDPHQVTTQAIGRLDQASANLDPEWASALVERAAPAYTAFANAPNYSHSVFDGAGTKTLMTLGARLVGTPRGEAALDRLAASVPANASSAIFARDAIGEGANPAYAIAVAARLKAEGKDPNFVIDGVNVGLARQWQNTPMASRDTRPLLDAAARLQSAGFDAGPTLKVAADGLREKTAADVKQLAEHSTELSWVVRNHGAGLSSAQLGKAVADYRDHKGAAWQAEDAALRKQVAEDGSRLIDVMTRMKALPPTPSGSTATTEGALEAMANDPSAGLAISTALQTDPSLVKGPIVKKLGDLFAGLKLGDAGRKFLNETASAYLRERVLDKLPKLDLANPASVAEAKAAIAGLRDEQLARLLGVSKSDLDKAVSAVQKAADGVASAPESGEQALADLNRKLDNDAALSKTFNKATFAGQLLRGVGVAFAGASVVNSYLKAAAPTGGVQDQIKLIVDAAGLAQKSCDLLVGLGKIDKSSFLGKVGGEWKVAGRAGASEFISGVSIALDGVSAVRSAFGLGVQQDLGNAALSATGAVGGGMTLAPSLGASASLGPVGLGVTAASIVGKVIYEKVNDAHKYEGVSRDFLRAGGYSDAAATALSKRTTWASTSPGASPMPYLARYAELKHVPQNRMQSWINGLTPQQMDHLSAHLRNAAMDTDGEAHELGNGSVQTTRRQTYMDGSFDVERMNTVDGLDHALARDRVPLPQ